MLISDEAAATTSTVKKRGDRAFDYAILDQSSDQITVDGYLVAWQYFTRSAGTPCPSYAAVWRRLHNNQYRFQLVQSTLLPNQGFHSVNFYYHTNEVTRVKKGDCPSIFVNKDARPECSGNLVSFDSSAGNGLYGNHALLTNFGTPNFTFDAPEQHQNRKLSIRPFVAGEFCS